MNSWLSPNLILPIITTFLGGTFAQLLIKLINRKPEVRSLRQVGDATLLGTATTYVDKLQVQITKLEERLDQSRKETENDKEALAERLNRAHTENVRLSNLVASLKTDLDIAYGQIRQLQEQLGRRI